MNNRKTSSMHVKNFGDLEAGSAQHTHWLEEVSMVSTKDVACYTERIYGDCVWSLRFFSSITPRMEPVVTSQVWSLWRRDVTGVTMRVPKVTSQVW